MHAIAFLKAINVGGHNVAKAKLVEVFERLGLEGVTTFIASGNVVFHKPSGALTELEARAEDALHAALGYPVPTFIRTPAQLKKAVEQRPFDGAGPETGGALHVGFLKTKPTRAALDALRANEAGFDRFHVDGTTLYWATNGRFSDSPFNGKKLEKALAQETTLRSIKTIVNIVEKWPA